MYYVSFGPWAVAKPNTDLLVCDIFLEAGVSSLESGETFTELP